MVPLTVTNIQIHTVLSYKGLNVFPMIELASRTLSEDNVQFLVIEFEVTNTYPTPFFTFKLSLFLRRGSLIATNLQFKRNNSTLKKQASILLALKIVYSALLNITNQLVDFFHLGIAGCYQR